MEKETADPNSVISSCNVADEKDTEDDVDDGNTKLGIESEVRGDNSGEYVNKTIVTPKKSGTGPFGSVGGTVYGTVAKGWEEVREAFIENFALNLERGAQLTIYQHSKLVVDLHGNGDSTPSESIWSSILSRKPKTIYNGGTIQNMYSSGKNMEVVCIALLVDRGLLAFSDLVTSVWPEFGQFGKEDLTIADVLRHEAGIPFFTNPLVMHKRSKDRQLKKKDVHCAEVLDRIIESSGKCYLYGKRHYHACTRGWILSGIIRRVDSQHRSLGQFMRDEICIPLNLDIYCGMPRALQQKLNIAKMIPMPSYSTMMQMAPACVGVSSDPTLSGILETFSSLDHPILRHNIGKWLISDLHCKVTNSVEGRAMEFPSANMHGNARSVAIINNIFANGGLVPVDVPCGPADRMKRVTRRFISAETVAKCFENPVIAHDCFLNSDTCFTQGGFAQMSEMRSIIVLPDFHETFNGFWGWGGVGGSWSLWNPEKGVSLAYMMNGRSLHPIGGPRGDRIVTAVQAVLARQAATAAASQTKSFSRMSP